MYSLANPLYLVLAPLIGLLDARISAALRRDNLPRPDPIWGLVRIVAFPLSGLALSEMVLYGLLRHRLILQFLLVAVASLLIMGSYAKLENKFLLYTATMGFALSAILPIPLGADWAAVGILVSLLGFPSLLGFGRRGRIERAKILIQIWDFAYKKKVVDTVVALLLITLLLRIQGYALI